MSKSLAQLQVEAAAEYWRLGVALPVSWFWAEGTIADGLSRKQVAISETFDSSENKR